MAFMKKTKGQLAADRALETEEAQARRLLWLLGQKKVQVPSERLADFMNFLVSVIYKSASAGIRLYAKGYVATPTCIDAENHVYTFLVRSEEDPNVEYHTSFSHIRRDEKRYELELSDLKPECNCRWASWGTNVKGGRIRICKHIFASMLYLVLHAKKDDLPKFRQLVNFLFFSVMWVNPSEAILKSIRKAQRDEYKAAWAGMLQALHAHSRSFSKEKEERLGEGIEARREEVSGEIKGFSASARQQIPVVAGILKAILGGLEKKHFSGWFDAVCPEILSALDMASAGRGLGYAAAGEARERAGAMRRQLGLLNAVAKKYEGTESDPLVRRCLETWAEGIRRRLLEAKSIEAYGIVTRRLSGHLLENIESEVALVVELWNFYNATSRMVWEMAREEKLHGLEEAIRKMKK